MKALILLLLGECSEERQGVDFAGVVVPASVFRTLFVDGIMQKRICLSLCHCIVLIAIIMIILLLYYFAASSVQNTICR